MFAIHDGGFEFCLKWPVRFYVVWRGPEYRQGWPRLGVDFFIGSRRYLYGFREV